MKLFFATVFLFLSTASAAPQLTPEALKCYKQALAKDLFFTLNKQYKSDDAIEKMAVAMCTYSDAPGSLRCYSQAQKDQYVFEGYKKVASELVMEERYAKLCSNSGTHLFNEKTGDADAIECFKSVIYNEEILKYAKEYMVTQELEDLALKFCISSNSIGAKTCYRESLANADEILKKNKLYKGPAALDQMIVDLCKGTRIR